MDMKSFIIKKLNEIQDLESKTLLREVMEQVFIPLAEYNDQKYTTLEQRIYNELPFQGNQYTIYTTVLERSQIDAGPLFLKPMQETDLQETSHTIKQIQEELTRTGRCHMFTVFLEADYLQCKQLAESKRNFHGILVTPQGELPATFRLDNTKRYTDCVSRLYRLFNANHIPWATVNSAYMTKFFDVNLASLDQENPPEDTVLNIQIDYAEYEKYIRTDKIPVWNIENIQVEMDDFSVPAGDKINHEYRYHLSKLGTEHGYLLDYDNTDIVTSRREGDYLIAVSTQEKDARWDLTKVIQRKDTITDQYSYELLSNKQKDSFTRRLAAHYRTNIKTKLELMRILQSFQTGNSIEFDSYHITEIPVLGETYAMNNFIEDQIRQAGGQKTMVLRFRPLKQKDFLTRDNMSFLVSQVQYIYPEYCLTGVLHT